ncbi:MAG: hypothetical protein GY810_18485 [Aureispira sp.]|nr:hypothetical protein [Aureispira sp.]
MNKEVLVENQVKAQDLIHEAFEVDNAEKARELAQKALELDAQNVDAHSFMGHTSSSIEEAINWYQKGTDLAKELLGEAFAANKGKFWQVEETQSYMNAKENLGMALHVADKKKEAVAHFQEMLELNPNDDQGVRYSLAIWLADLKDYAAYHKLYEQYKEDDAVIWKYTNAIALFQEGENIEKANKALLEAHETNPHVLPYLTAQKEIPEETPDVIEIGGESEAIDCVDDIIILLAEEASDTLLWIFSFYEWINKE